MENGSLKSRDIALQLLTEIMWNFQKQNYLNFNLK